MKQDPEVEEAMRTSESLNELIAKLSANAEFLSDMGVELVESTLEDRHIARAARASFNLDDGSEANEARDAGLIRRLWRDGHGTPFEYPTATIALKVPIFVHNQIVKHRISTINTKSGRYSEFAPRFYIPSSDRKIFQAGKAMDYDMRGDEEMPYSKDIRDFVTTQLDAQARAWYAMYRMSLAGGVAKEVARMGMPLNTYTECWVHMNLRSWFNFIALRYYNPELGFHSHGQAEVSEVAEKVLEILKEKYPVATEAFLESVKENNG